MNKWAPRNVARACNFLCKNINFYINFLRQQPCVGGFRLDNIKVRKRNSVKNYEWEL